MKQKVLITGASGFVGGFLVEEALNRGLEVYAAVRASSNRQYLTDSRIQFIQLDFEDVDALAHDLEQHQFDYFIHNAGVTKTANIDNYYKVNAEYLRNIISATNKLITLFFILPKIIWKINCTVFSFLVNEQACHILY